MNPPLEPSPGSTTRELMVPPPSKPSPPVGPAPVGSRWWRWTAVIAIAIAAGALWYFQPWSAKGQVVTVETVAPAPLIRVLAVNGRIAPQHLVDVKPTVGGRLVVVLAEAGAKVTEGDVLARVDASVQQAMVRQALAGLDAALVGQAQAHANLVRAEALSDNITRKALEDAQNAGRTADQEVARQTAAFDQAQIEVTKYTLTAPVTGTILTRTAEEGQTVDATKPVFTMADLTTLVVETDVDETYAAQITTGLAAVLQLKGETGKLDGHVSFVAPQVDAATGGLAVKIAFDAPVTAPVGLTATANIIVDQKDAAISVPRAAVVTDVAGSAVYLAVAGIATRRAVTVVDWPAARLEVTTGLVAGDVVIVDATGLSNGAAVVVPDPADAGP